MGRSYKTVGTVAGLVLLAGQVFADPPPPNSKPTICPTVQCMRVNNVIDNLDGTFDVDFEAFNWFNTTADDGVNHILMFTGNLVSKICLGGVNPSDFQAEVIGATAPPGWTVTQADIDKVQFSTTSSVFEIPELDLCDPSVLGGCVNGGGPGISTCGNSQSGFVVTLRPNFPTGSICSWTANWRNLDEFGVDNGDVMNFGAVSWTFGSLTEDYSNVGYPPSSFDATGNEDCVQKVQKRAAKFALLRIKQHAKCNDKVNKGLACDEALRDSKVDNARLKLFDTIDRFCTNDDQVANAPWCGTTIANLKTCLDAQITAATDAALSTTYGPQ